MKIIMLAGESNSGKTQTLNGVYDCLVQSSEIVQKKTQLGGNENDFECVLKYQNMYIAIYTMGDYLNTCYEAIIKYADKDILLMAYNTQFAAGLDKTVKKNKNHIVVNKTKNNHNDIDSIVKILATITNVAK